MAGGQKRKIQKCKVNQNFTRILRGRFAFIDMRSFEAQYASEWNSCNIMTEYDRIDIIDNATRENTPMNCRFHEKLKLTDFGT